ncbi:MAG: response regulator transcription factor [Dehalococcoidia bacterium]|nr:response regulator transcription factor [Dehalococcoidia bacterium]
MHKREGTVGIQSSLREEVLRVLDHNRIKAGILVLDPADEYEKSLVRARAGSPDIVLLDIAYPSLAGVDLCKRLARSIQGIRIVLVSTNPGEDAEELADAVTSGAVAYWRSEQSPPGELTSLIKVVLQGGDPMKEMVVNKPAVAARLLKRLQSTASYSESLSDPATLLKHEEQQVLTLLAGGGPRDRIMDLAGISEEKLEQCVGSILRKLRPNHPVKRIPARVGKEPLRNRIARDGNLFILNVPT